MSFGEGTLLNRLTVLALAAALFCSGTLAQKQPAKQDDRIVLEQILKQTYQPSLIGKQMMGIGGETDVRRAGTIVVIQRPGLFGSLLHNEPASSSIKGLSAELFRGHKDYDVPVGERYYVTAVAVGSDTILVGLLTARSVPTQSGAGHLWTTLSFKFPAEVLADADKTTVFQAFDQWFLPEGRATSALPAAAPVAASATAPVAAPATQPAYVAQPVAAPRASSAQESTLTPGMTREQILQYLGAADREIHFGQRQWLIYPGIVAALYDNKLESVETSGKASAKVNVQSDPTGAEIYLDDQLVGSTPSSLLLAPGKHAFRLHAAGRADWSRQVNILMGSDISLTATLDKN